MRETTQFTTPKGHIIVANTYLTGKESRQLQQALLKGVEVSSNQGMAELTHFSAERMLDAQDTLITCLVVSIDNMAENCLDHILNLPSDEYEFIVAELNKITADWSKKK